MKFRNVEELESGLEYVALIVDCILEEQTESQDTMLEVAGWDELKRATNQCRDDFTEV